MDAEERRFENRWDMMKQVLGAEYNGDELRGVSSTRTLFGIKSHAEEVIERIAAEQEAARLEQIRQEREERERSK